MRDGEVVIVLQQSRELTVFRRSAAAVAEVRKKKREGEKIDR